jgi:phosphopantetheinyl transferase
MMSMESSHLHDGRHISISHSNDFSAVVISNEILGLDIEQIKEKNPKNCS